MQMSSDFRARSRTSHRVWQARGPTESIEGLLAGHGPVVLLIFTCAHSYVQNSCFLINQCPFVHSVETIQLHEETTRLAFCPESIKSSPGFRLSVLAVKPASCLS